MEYRLGFVYHHFLPRATNRLRACPEQNHNFIGMSPYEKDEEPDLRARQYRDGYLMYMDFFFNLSRIRGRYEV